MPQGHEGEAAKLLTLVLGDLTCGPEVLDGADPIAPEAVAPDHCPLALRAADVKPEALGRLRLIVSREVVRHDVADGRDAVESQDPNAVATIEVVRAVDDPIFFNSVM